jgi:hypothetical protein
VQNVSLLIQFFYQTLIKIREEKYLPDSMVYTGVIFYFVKESIIKMQGTCKRISVISSRIFISA